MKLLLALALVALLGLGLTACSDTEKSTSSTSPAVSNIVAPASASARVDTSSLIGDNDDEEEHNSGSPVGDEDADVDNDAKELRRYYDPDDSVVRAYGHAAGVADYQALTAVVKRYYAAAYAGNGPLACAIISPAVAKTIPREYGSGAGPPFMRGKSCPAVMSLFFKHYHHQLTTVSHITGVRVKGGEALVLVGSKSVPTSSLDLVREGNAWRVVDLIATPLP